MKMNVKTKILLKMKKSVIEIKKFPTFVIEFAENHSYQVQIADDVLMYCQLFDMAFGIGLNYTN